ncbi:MAG: hypothetical protein K1X74_10715 [Pirellulales bacterium]|nr:hypothetical protein [Pirellulales bacterium]
MPRQLKRMSQVLVLALLLVAAAGNTAQAARLGLLCPPPDCCTKTFTVIVCHPCTGCEIPIDLCIPCCCDGCPVVSERCTLIGAGLVRYDWCCGFTAVIRFDKCGGYKVHYRG